MFSHLTLFCLLHIETVLLLFSVVSAHVHRVLSVQQVTKILTNFKISHFLNNLNTFLGYSLRFYSNKTFLWDHYCWLNKILAQRIFFKLESFDYFLKAISSIQLRSPLIHFESEKSLEQKTFVTFIFTWLIS